MNKTSYTVKEIDSLRFACEHKWFLDRTYLKGNLRIGRPFTEEEKVKCVEELVRTYMLAGITGEELRDSFK